MKDSGDNAADEKPDGEEDERSTGEIIGVIDDDPAEVECMFSASVPSSRARSSAHCS